jgi:hypothetical protein
MNLDQADAWNIQEMSRNERSILTETMSQYRYKHDSNIDRVRETSLLNAWKASKRIMSQDMFGQGDACKYQHKTIRNLPRRKKK